MLTRKHFQRMADVVVYTRKLGSEGHPVREETLRVVARELADMCRAENPAFDRARFLAACGFPDA